jgi:hypothetical protein
MEPKQTPADFLAFTAEQVDRLTVEAKKAIQKALVAAPREVCAWAQFNLEHWLWLARDSLRKNITITDEHQAACDIVNYLCVHYHLPRPSR